MSLGYMEDGLVGCWLKVQECCLAVGLKTSDTFGVAVPHGHSGWNLLLQIVLLLKLHNIFLRDYRFIWLDNHQRALCHRNQFFRRNFFGNLTLRSNIHLKDWIGLDYLFEEFGLAHLVFILYKFQNICREVCQKLKFALQTLFNYLLPWQKSVLQIEHRVKHPGPWMP